MLKINSKILKEWKEIYSNSIGSNKNISLDQKLSTSNKIKITYKYQGMYVNSIEIDLKYGNAFTLYANYIMNGNYIFIFGAYKIEENNLVMIENQFGYSDGSAVHIDNNNYFYITKIEYK